MSIEVKISSARIPYKKAMIILEKRVEEVKKGLKKELIWILEHPTTFTGGIRSNKNEILDKKIKIIKTNRGGKITLHNPGQRIVYLVIDLNKRKKDIRLLIKTIEESIIEVLKIYKIYGYSDRKNIGIWAQNKKISAIGIKVKRWVAYHGCSININNDLSNYKKIIPCGLSNDKITSFHDLGIKRIPNLNKNIIKVFTKNLTKI
ncbi:MAG: lipoyl(octanoyl) transferase [Candidatus Pelagibacter sp.]|nr:lipoyl(octanoyl) transferase [Candidatus Pelagibacter sp.]OUW68020.1 MAG: lipoyl(octanoyl) transferase [Candidatus Pelagibacter sp. TMED202]